MLLQSSVQAYNLPGRLLTVADFFVDSGTAPVVTFTEVAIVMAKADAFPALTTPVAFTYV